MHPVVRQTVAMVLGAHDPADHLVARCRRERRLGEIAPVKKRHHALRHHRRGAGDDGVPLFPAAGRFPAAAQPDQHPAPDRHERAPVARHVPGHPDRRHRPLRRLGAGAFHDVVGDRGCVGLALAGGHPDRPHGGALLRHDQRRRADAAPPPPPFHHDARHAQRGTRAHQSDLRRPADLGRSRSNSSARRRSRSRSWGCSANSRSAPSCFSSASSAWRSS